MQNWKTSLFGILGGVAFFILASPPPFISADQQKIVIWFAGGFIAALGLSAKDGRKMPPSDAPPTEPKQ